MTQYVGITIGPILATLSKVRATRELWAASFLFSRLMELLVEEMPKQHLRVLLPGKLPAGSVRYGAGVYPDKMLVTGDEQSMQRAQQAIGAAVQLLEAEIIRHLPAKKQVFDKWSLAKYLQTYLVGMKGEDPIEAWMQISQQLDVAELRAKYTLHEDPAEVYLLAYFDGIRGSKWFDIAFGQRRQSIPTLAEISTAELAQKENSISSAYLNLLLEWRRENEERLQQVKGRNKKLAHEKEAEGLIHKLESADNALKDELQAFHKYTAVVYADGDNLGKLILKLEASEVKIFSEALMRFALESAKLIDSQNGLPVYIGGDDMLFFAPVLFENSSVFELLDQLDELFQGIFEEMLPQALKRLQVENAPLPSLSFGVAISYYKFPLNEAIAASQHQLFGVAKNFQAKDGKQKNAIAFQVQKHSGQVFGQVYGIQTQTYHHFKDLLLTDAQDAGRFVNSIGYKLQNNPKVFELIGAQEQRVSDFIDNSFNEPIHDHAAKAFLGRVKHLITSGYQEYEQASEAEKAIYGALRTIHFLRKGFYDE